MALESSNDFVMRAEIQFGLADDCIRACVYLDRITRRRLGNESLPEFWEALWGVLYSDAINSWCQLFGSDNNESHWKKFVKDFSLTGEGSSVPVFGKSLISSSLGITEDDWCAYHTDLVDFRNKRTSHLDHTWSAERLPDLNLALGVCCLYRDWLAEFLTAWPKTSSRINVEVSANDAIRIFARQITEVLDLSTGVAIAR